jgi:hypothetical protein
MFVEPRSANWQYTSWYYWLICVHETEHIVQDWNGSDKIIAELLLSITYCNGLFIVYYRVQ